MNPYISDVAIDTNLLIRFVIVDTESLSLMDSIVFDVTHVYILAYSCRTD
jgi:hypothetical protein